jgi:hypothetical protein
MSAETQEVSEYFSRSFHQSAQADASEDAADACTHSTFEHPPITQQPNSYEEAKDAADVAHQLTSHCASTAQSASCSTAALENHLGHVSTGTMSAETQDVSEYFSRPFDQSAQADASEDAADPCTQPTFEHPLATPTLLSSNHLNDDERAIAILAGSRALQSSKVGPVTELTGQVGNLVNESEDRIGSPEFVEETEDHDLSAVVSYILTSFVPTC